MEYVINLFERQMALYNCLHENSHVIIKHIIAHSGVHVLATWGRYNTDIWKYMETGDVNLLR